MKKHIHGGDIYSNNVNIDFSANINPMGIPKGVSIAAKLALDMSVNYPDPNYIRLRSRLAETYSLGIENISVGNGAGDLIYRLVQMLKPKKALLLSPTFSEYENALVSVCCDISYYELKEDNDFSLKNDFLNYLTNIDIVFICNPNNPVGNLIPKGTMIQIADKCRREDILLVIDECFMDFCETRAKTSMTPLLFEYKNMFILKAFTKLYAIPGLRLGFGLSSNTDLIDGMKNITQAWPVSLVAEESGIAALLEKKYLNESLSLIAKERLFLLNGLRNLSLKVFKPKANYILFKGPTNLSVLLLEKGILIRDCSNYRGLSQGFYRVAVKKHADNKAILRTIKNILER